MSYAHKSGYQKRKERADREKKLASAQTRQSSLTALVFEQKTQVSAADQTNRQDIISVVSVTYQPSTSTEPDKMNNMHDIQANRQDIDVAVTYSLTLPDDVECAEISSTENLTGVDLSRSQSQIIRNEVIIEYELEVWIWSFCNQSKSKKLFIAVI